MARGARSVLAVVAAALVLVAGAPATATGAPRVTSGIGVMDRGGRVGLVEVLARVEPGEDARAVAEGALRDVGARPLGEEPILGFALAGGGIHWPQFDQPPRQRQAVPLFYNPAGDRSRGAGEAAFTTAAATWSDVPLSVFAFGDAGRTDRCPSIYCEGTLDGANDVAWLAMPGSRFLAVATLFFFLDSLEIIEADVAFNSAAADWSSDGSGFDVETVMLHELGHVAGLDHISDEDAVMYPFLAPGEMKRELTESEIEGIRHLYPRAAHLRPTQPLLPAPPIQASVVAALGDPAPGSGVMHRNIEMGEISDAGHVAFVSDVLVAGEPSGQVAVRAGRLGLEELARTGDPAPGGAQLGLGTLGPVALSSTGDAAFAFLMGPFEPPFGRNGGVFHRPVTGATTAIAPLGASTPAHGPLRGARDADATDDGRTVFAGLVDAVADSPPSPPPSPPPPPPPPPSADELPPPPAPLRQGVFEAGPEGLLAIAAPGDAAPGGSSLRHAGHPTANRRGDVAFDAVTTAYCSDPDASSCPTGVYRRRSTGEVEAIATPFQGAPDGGPGTLVAAAGPVLNDRGEVAFAGELSGTGRVEPVDEFGNGLEPVTEVLFVASSGSTRRIIATDDPLPMGSHVWSLLRGVARGRPDWTLNDRGEVAFVATLTDAVFGDGVISNGVYVFREGRVRLVARSGTRVLDVGTIRAIGTLVSLPPTPWDPSPFLLIRGGVGLSDTGEAVFPATLTDGRVVLLQTRA